MRTTFILFGLVLFATTSLLAQNELSEYEKNWPQWRGPHASGVAPAGNPPLEWSEKKNVRWKVEIPGSGHATPVIWDNQVIILTAVPTDRAVEPPDEGSGDENSWMKPNKTNLIHEFVVLSVDRRTGEIQWQKTMREELPHSHTHNLGSWASNSPVTDGQYIYASFGSHGLYCLDMDGEPVWERDLGVMEKRASFGDGSSPLLHQDKLFILRDHEGQSTLHALDAGTGNEIWVVERDERSSWSTPYVVERDGEAQIIVSATNRIRSYDPDNGKVLWSCGGMTGNVIPMPVQQGDMICFSSGFRGSALVAVDLSRASGDITGTDAVVWTYGSNTPYTPSPILMNGRLYFMRSNNGFLTCLDAVDGKENYVAERLQGIKSIFASPVGVKDRIYIPGAEGVFQVVEAGKEFEILATNTLEDGFHASPVILGDELFLRGFRYLYCIAAGE